MPSVRAAWAREKAFSRPHPPAPFLLCACLVCTARRLPAAQSSILASQEQAFSAQLELLDIHEALASPVSAAEVRCAAPCSRWLVVKEALRRRRHNPQHPCPPNLLAVLSGPAVTDRRPSLKPMAGLTADR